MRRCSYSASSPNSSSNTGTSSARGRADPQLGAAPRRGRGAVSQRGSAQAAVAAAIRVDLVDRGRAPRRARPLRARSPRPRPPAGRARSRRPQSSGPPRCIPSIASIVEPPVVTTSSTSTQRSPGSSGGPSIQRCKPCSLRCLRTMNPFAPAARGERGAGHRVAPTVTPPTALARHVRACAASSTPSATKASGAGSRAWRPRSTAQCAHSSASPRRSPARARAAAPRAARARLAQLTPTFGQGVHVRSNLALWSPASSAPLRSLRVRHLPDRDRLVRRCSSSTRRAPPPTQQQNEIRARRLRARPRRASGASEHESALHARSTKPPMRSPRRSRASCRTLRAANGPRAPRLRPAARALPARTGSRLGVPRRAVALARQLARCLRPRTGVAA